MQDLDKYLNTARKAELDNVPFDKDGIGSMLQKHREAGSQNFFKKILSKYGKLKMYSIMSIITASILFISSMMLDSNDSNPTVKAKNIQITIGNDTTNIENYNSDEHDLVDIALNKSTPTVKAKNIKIISGSDTTNIDNYNSDEHDLVDIALNNSTNSINVENTQNNEEDEYEDFISIGSSLKIHKDMLDKDEQGNYIIPMNRGVKEFDKLLTTDEVLTFADKFQKDNRGKFKDTTFLIYSPLNSSQSKYLRWQHLVFDNATWNLNTSVPNSVKLRYASDANAKGRLEYANVNIALDNESDFFRLMNEMENNISKTLDVSLLKELCNVPLSDYYSKLEEITLRIDNADIAKQALLYANMNRMLIGNPFAEFKLKDKGLLLPQESLEKLGFKFYDNKFTYPLDETFTEKSPKFFADEAYNKNKEVLKNGVEEWFINSKDGKLDPEWGKHIRMMLSSTTERSTDSDFLKEDHIQGYVQLSYPELVTSREVNVITPISKRNGHDFGLYLSSLKNSNVSDLKELYNLNAKYRDLQSIMSEKKSDEVSEQDRNELKKLELTANNALHTLKYSKLIPIEIPIPYGIHSKEELAKDDFSSVTLWYYPDEKFLDALPVEIRDKVVKEMNLLESVVAGELPASDACQALDGEESLLGLCNLADMAIQNLNAAPNPTDGNCEISYSLTEERYTKMMLLDNSGRYVKDIADWQNQTTGEYNFNLDISSLPNGNYNIAVFTNKNEKIMFKLMKK